LSIELQEQLVFFGCLVVAIIVHEISHGVVALSFGDDTAKRAGRLTLNPLPHIDPFGTIVLPALLVLAGFGAFGWAKPVPVNASRMRNPRRDLLLVSLAGPGSNFALMAIAAIAARAAFQSAPAVSRIGELPLLTEVLLFFALANLLLGVFNLLPVPPLDGASLIERALRREWLPTWHRIRPYGLLVLLVLVFSTNVLGRVFAPLVERLFSFIVDA
jgi:Zn-dependent protease